MNKQRIAGIILIAVFVLVMLTTMVNAPGLYETQNISERLQIIEMYKTRWIINQAIVALYLLLTVVGFSILAPTLRTAERDWLPILGAGAVAVGTISGLYFVYLQTIDPRGGYSGAYPGPENLAYWLWLAGLLFFGIALLRFGLPKWLGFLNAGVAVLYGIIFLLTGAGFMTPFLMGFLDLVIGIALLRQ